jgi:hypothetical protein
VYIAIPNPICFKLERHDDRRAFSLALEKTGNKIAARIAMIAITTKSSIRVKARRWPNLLFEVDIISPIDGSIIPQNLIF